MKPRFILSLLSLVTLAGCASWGKGGTETTEQLLAAAGFRLYYARDAQEQVNLKNIPQRQLVSMRGAAKPTYLFADDGECDCVYVGGDDQLKEYRRLNGIKRGADGAVLSAEMRENYMTGGGMGGMGMGGVMGGFW